MLSNSARKIVPFVVSQHAADLGIAWATRRDHVRAPHVALRHLRRVDDRIAANLDGCAVAGPNGIRIVLEQLVDPGAPAVFAATAMALETADMKAFTHCIAVADALPECVHGLVSALGWIGRDRLAGIGRSLLDSSDAFRRRLGLAACRLHRTDPGSILAAALRDEDARVQIEAIRCRAALGNQELVAADMLRADDQQIQFWLAWAAVLVGGRGTAVERLAAFGMEPGPHRIRAFCLLLQTMSVTAGRDFLRALPDRPRQSRLLIQGAGLVGDPAHIAWLIEQMADEKPSRVAGEAFTLITGADLALLDLERKPPDNFESGPNDDPDDPNVEMDPDDGLPWPDVDRIEKWWAVNQARFEKGTRYFMGKPVTREHCIDVLKNGYQRQRILAAHYLCLLEPGTPLFNTSAPAWRQQRLLAAM